jgi:hypothetical protein
MDTLPDDRSAYESWHNFTDCVNQVRVRNRILITNYNQTHVLFIAVSRYNLMQGSVRIWGQKIGGNRDYFDLTADICLLDLTSAAMSGI